MKQKAVSRIIKVLFIILFIELLSCKVNISNKSSESCTCKTYLKKNADYCQILNILMDTASYQKNGINSDCFVDIIFKLYQATCIEPLWGRPEFQNWEYNSLSMDKSLFKDNLLDWMRYFKCPDTTILLRPTNGKYNFEELQILKSRGVDVKQ